MKALSLWQPWATLIAIGAKTYETRSWSTDYRGPLLIHASKTDKELQTCYVEPFREALVWGGFKNPLELPLGAAVAICDLVDVMRVENVSFGTNSWEKAFGDYSAGRFAWKLANVKRLDPVVPMRGMQGLFPVDWDAPNPIDDKPKIQQLRMF